MRPSQKLYNTAPWMRTAHREKGVRELLDGELNPRLLTYFASTRYPLESVDKKTKWCGAFVSWVLEHASPPYRSQHSAHAADYMKWGFELAAPKWGCVAVFEHHVAFWETGTTTTATLFGGNQRNQVCLALHELTGLLGYRWPIAPNPLGKPRDLVL